MMRAFMTTLALAGSLWAGAAATADEPLSGNPQVTAKTAQFVLPTAGQDSTPVQAVNYRNWRYRWHNNRWWYWMPGNYWMVYNNGGWNRWSAGYNFGPTYSYGYSYPRSSYYGGYYGGGYAYPFSGYGRYGYRGYAPYGRYYGGYYPSGGYRYGSGYRGGYAGSYPYGYYNYGRGYNGARAGAAIGGSYGGRSGAAVGAGVGRSAVRGGGGWRR